MSNPLHETWHVSETQEDAAVIYVERTLPSDGSTFAHVLFEADWGDEELAEHIAKLHNVWLARRKAEFAPPPPSHARLTRGTEG